MLKLLDSVARIAKIEPVFEDFTIELDFYNNGSVNDERAQELVEKLRNNKGEVISILEYLRSPEYIAAVEEELIGQGYLPLSPGECYEKQITRNSHVLIQRIDENKYTWSAYRITYDGGDLKSEKIIAEHVNLRSLLDRSERYIENYLSFIKNR